MSSCSLPLAKGRGRQQSTIRSIFSGLIAFWLGHESVETTQVYLSADLALKEKFLAKTRPLQAPAGRFRPDEHLLTFLKGL